MNYFPQISLVEGSSLYFKIVGVMLKIGTAFRNCPANDNSRHSTILLRRSAGRSPLDTEKTLRQVISGSPESDDRSHRRRQYPHDVDVGKGWPAVTISRLYLLLSLEMTGLSPADLGSSHPDKLQNKHAHKTTTQSEQPSEGIDHRNDTVSDTAQQPRPCH